MKVSRYTRGHGGWRSTAVFAGQFLRHGRRIASLVPSSPRMARSLCCDIDPNTPQTIVELGAGTGVVTEAALARMHPDSRLIAVETNARLARIARQRCGQAEVLRQDAGRLGDRFDQLGVTRVDVIINCLSTPTLPVPVTRGILEWASHYCETPRFTQLTEVPYFYLRWYRRIFEQVRFQHVPLNIPPGGIYHCVGLRDGYQRHLAG